MDLKDLNLSEEQLEQIKHAESPAELHQIAHDLGYELNDKQLDAIAGGGGWNKEEGDCPEWTGREKAW